MQDFTLLQILVTRSILPGENINLCNEKGYTLLMCCVGEHYTDGVKQLLDARANVNHMGNDGNTALHLACFFGDMDIIMLLVDHLAFLDVENEYGVTPLGMACISNQIDVVQYFCSIGADPSQGMVTPLQISLMYRCFDITHYLLDAKADPRIFRKSFKDITIPCSSLIQEAIKRLGDKVFSPIDFVHQVVMIFTMEYGMVDDTYPFSRLLTHMCKMIKPFDWSTKDRGW